MTNPTTYAAALLVLERTDKGANAGHLARSLHLTWEQADKLERELLANGDARRLPNGRLGRAYAGGAR